MAFHVSPAVKMETNAAQVTLCALILAILGNLQIGC